MIKENSEYLPEQWKPIVIKGTTTKYLVSNYCRVRNIQDDVFVAQVLTGIPSYFYVNLKLPCGKRILRRVHRLMAEAFIPNPDNMPVIDHIDRNRYNNAIDNLRCTDKKGNSRNRDCTIITPCGDTLRDYCSLNYPQDKSAYGYIHGRISTLGSIDKAIEDYNESLTTDIRVRKVTLNTGEEVYVHKLLESLGISWVQCKVLLTNGLSYSEIAKGYNTPLPTRTYEGLECDTYWYPTVKYIHKRYDISPSRLKDLMGRGFSVTEAINTPKSSLAKIYTVKGFSGTLKEISAEFNVELGLLQDRVSNKKISIEEAVILPRQRLVYYWFNGKKMKRVEILKHLLPNKCPRSLGAEMSKKKLTLVQLLELHNVDTSEISIVPVI